MRQLADFRLSDPDAAKRADDLLDCYTYGVASALGNRVCEVNRHFGMPMFRGESSNRLDAKKAIENWKHGSTSKFKIEVIG